MKKAILLIPLLLFLFIPTEVQAKWLDMNSLREKVKGRKIEVKNEVRKELQESLRQDSPAGTLSAAPVLKKTSLLKNIRERLEKEIPFLLPAGVSEAKIVEIGGTTTPTTIKVSKADEIITLNITEKTNILRKFGGKSSLSELHVGDIVNVRGKWQDSTKAILETLVLRDLSIQKRKATFWGKIKSIDAANKSFIFETNKRGEQKVIVSNETKIVNRRHQQIAFSALSVGDRVRVSGVWDITLKQIDEVSLIKDWSVGPKPSLTPTITP